MNDFPDHASIPAVDKPAGPVDSTVGWGSDVVAQMLRRLDIPWIALNPGASYRGLHDSLVNHLGNERPGILMCLHEEHAVAISQGYAKATGRPLAVALHSNVGLMHASMAIFNAWCDRQPMLILGATGPVDAAKRRPWIDWVHTSQDQAALVRNFIKWDDQPASVAALPDSILRARQQMETAPMGPVYVCLDATIQEEKIEGAFEFPDPARYAPPPPPRPAAEALAWAAELLAGAKRPIILFGRGRRGQAEWDNRVALAERLGAGMLSDLKAGSMVPSDHPLHVGAPFNKLHKAGRQALREADLILSIGWIDPGGLLRQAFGGETPAATIIHAGQDLHLHNGWGKEHAALAPMDVHMICDPDAAVADLLAALPADLAPGTRDAEDKQETAAASSGAITQRDLATALKAVLGERPVTFPCLPRGWPGDVMPHRDPLAYLGKDGGGGVGSGPGIIIGAALALRGSGRLTIGVTGDGDCLMSINALWTAARYHIPAMIIVANNRSYFNDEMHQETVALARGRNPANRAVGQAIADPTPDIARLAEAQGVEARGPITRIEDLEPALREGVAAIVAGRPFLVDVLVDPTHGREAPLGAADRGAAA
jgi:thiamine pyrophosphate-dependent acetolactate synthase large subunit-like protein